MVSPVFDLTSGLSYKKLSYASRKGITINQRLCVNVYDQGKLVEGSPFSSYSKAALAVFGTTYSSMISQKIDTKKLYKKRYSFESVKS